MPADANLVRVFLTAGEILCGDTQWDVKLRFSHGVVTGEAWINGTLRARLDRNMIAALSKENRIARIDVPHVLKSDAR